MRHRASVKAVLLASTLFVLVLYALDRSREVALLVGILAALATAFTITTRPKPHRTKAFKDAFALVVLSFVSVYGSYTGGPFILLNLAVIAVGEALERMHG